MDGAPRKHILVVEDDESIRGLVQDLLSDHGYSVAVAEEGSQALDEMRRQRPDLVLLDLMLPGMNGWAFLRERERDRELARVPVLVISATGPSGFDEAQGLGAPVYLAKPFDIDKLVSEIDRLCASPVRQCAWCGRAVDEAGEFRLPSGRKLRWATHGICPICKAAERESLESISDP